MKTNSSTPQTRWAKRSLKQQLLYKFLNEYGYERGAVVAEAIVTDILQLIEEVYSDRLPPCYTNWPAVPVDNGKSPQIQLLEVLHLTIQSHAGGPSRRAALVGTPENSAEPCCWRSVSDFFNASRMNDMDADPNPERGVVSTAAAFPRWPAAS